MIKAFLLIFNPAGTWDKIEQEHHRVVTILFTFLLPLMLLTSAIEAAGLLKLGETRGTVMERVVKVPQSLVVRYALTQVVLSLVIIFGGAWALQGFGAGFHRRHTYTECFSTLSYSLSPLFLARMLDAMPAFNTWFCWGVGILLSVSGLYRGIPRIMKPDPSNALGLYLLSSLSLIIITGLAHFLQVLVLEEKIFTRGFG